ncbi:hypothetical protein HZ326_29865 [Fusarium oxysporum f. sp. albedinis]|nr:hypothetical protein HZ326_29865 [Fusarium oxysporum f. sp. albedinis]
MTSCRAYNNHGIMPPVLRRSRSYGHVFQNKYSTLLPPHDRLYDSCCAELRRKVDRDHLTSNRKTNVLCILLTTVISKERTGRRGLAGHLAIVDLIARSFKYHYKILGPP